MFDTTFDMLPESLKSVRMRPLFVMRLNVRPLQIVGRTPSGLRRVGVVFGGSFTGDRLSGDVLDGGNDWQIVRGDGATTLDVRLVLKAADGTMVAMTYRGLRRGPSEIIEQIENGAVVDPSTYYFRIAPFFEVAPGPLSWLNEIIAVGVGHRKADGPIYSVFEVE